MTGVRSADDETVQRPTLEARARPGALTVRVSEAYDPAPSPWPPE